MSYQVTFAPTEEKMKEYNTYHVSDEEMQTIIDSEKRLLIITCMKESIDDFSTIIVLKNHIDQIYSLIENHTKSMTYQRWKNDTNHKVYFTGWHLANDSYISKDECIKMLLDKLFLLACIVKTPDYFDDREKFYAKLSSIGESIDEFIDDTYTTVTKNIVNDLNEFQVQDTTTKDLE